MTSNLVIFDLQLRFMSPAGVPYERIIAFRSTCESFGNRCSKKTLNEMCFKRFVSIDYRDEQLVPRVELVVARYGNSSIVKMAILEPHR